MKAIRIAKFGGPNVLEVQTTVDLPKLTHSSVLVKIICAGVNPVDTYIREGAFSNLPDLPFTPGKDGAGLVHAVGENVKDFQVGQRVFVCKKDVDTNGTYAEYSLVNQNNVFPLEDRLSFEEGAALGIPYFTAYRAIVLKAKSCPGETILVHGASGAVGLASVQLAKNLGLKVIGTAGTDVGMTVVKNVGADFVLCHKEKDYLDKIMEITDNKGVDIIVEMLANVNLDKDLDVIAPNGRVVIVGSRGTTKIDPRKTMGSEAHVFGVALLASTPDQWQQTAQGILSGIKDGWVNPVIDKKYSLEDACHAHKDIIQSTGAKGKLILTVAEE